MKERYLALKNLEKSPTKKSVAETFSAPQKSLTYWIKLKEEIINQYESGQFEAKRQKCLKARFR